MPDEANASNSLLIISAAISNCSGGRLLKRSDMLWASFPLVSPNRIESLQHEAAKKAFDALGGKPIPKVAQLSQEYATLLAEKQEQYAEYKALRQDMIDYRTMKQNVDKILGLMPEEQEQQRPER